MAADLSMSSSLFAFDMVRYLWTVRRACEVACTKTEESVDASRLMSITGQEIRRWIWRWKTDGQSAGRVCF